MKCALCDTETDQATPFAFYYGNDLGKGVQPAVGGSRTGARFRIAGREEGFLCRQCLANDAMSRLARWDAPISVLLVGAGVVCLLIAGSVGSERADGAVAFLAIAGLAATILATWRAVVSRILAAYQRGDPRVLLVFTGNAGIASADRQAMRARQATLRRNGYDAFFTRQEYERLGLGMEQYNWTQPER